MENLTTGFIGAGNIARAIMGGLVAGGRDPGSIRAADPSGAQLAQCPEGVIHSTGNRELAERSDVIVLCVKPNLVESVAKDIVGASSGKLVISVAAGITTATLTAILGEGTAVIRCMPNTPALVGCGMTGLYATDSVTAAQRDIAAAVLAAVGKTRWFTQERDLDKVTAISGSGPAYFFLVMESLVAAAVELGLPADVAGELVRQTALGAAEMANLSPEDVDVLRRNVTSPGGTTEAAVTVLLESGLPGDFKRAAEAAFKRSLELSGATD